MDLVKAMQSFVRVVNTGSFAAAANQLGVSPGIVTRNVQLLEDHLGARLINRTTRRLSVTDIGREYHDFCTRTLVAIKEAEMSIAGQQSEPSGVLKLLIPKSFGTLHMSGALSDFMLAYPDVRIAATLSDFTVPSLDLIENGFDAAIRLTAQRDSSLVVRRIATTEWVLVGAPHYIERHGAPEGVDDLAAHACLVHTSFSNTVWSFRKGRQSREVNVKAAVSTNSVLFLRDLVVKGLGIALLPTYCMYQDLLEGRIVRLLPDMQNTSASICVVYPHSKLLPAKVRHFIDFMALRFKSPVWEAAER